MRILGIDPGTAIMGYGLVEDATEGPRMLDYGCIRPRADDLPQRLAVLHRELHRLLEVHRPHVVAVEELFFGRNVRTALAVGHARGVAILAAALEGLPVREYTPSEIKQSVAGYGRAEKAQMQRMVQQILRLPSLPQPDDAADALAVAICCLNRRRMEEILA